MPSEIYEVCLGIAALGQCKAYFHDEFSFYNLGTAIATIGILIAGYQVLDERFKFRHRFRLRMRNFSAGLMIFNLIFVIIGTLLPFLPGKSLPLLGYRPSWEFLGAMFFILGMTLAVIISIHPIENLTLEKLDSFCDLVTVYLAKGELGFEIISKEIPFFFGGLFKLVADKNPDAVKLMLILADYGLLVKLSENPNAIVSIVQSYQEYRKTNSILIEDHGFFKRFVNECLNNRESIISRELQEKSFGGINQWNGVYFSFLLEDVEMLIEYGVFEGFGYSKFKRDKGEYGINYPIFIEKVFNHLAGNVSKIESSMLSKILGGAFSVTSGLVADGDEDIWRLVGWLDDAQRLFTALECNHQVLFPEGIPETRLNENDIEFGIIPNNHRNSRYFFDVYSVGIFGLLDAIERRKWRTEGGNVDRHTYLLLLPTYRNRNTGAISGAIESGIQSLFKGRVIHNLNGWYPMSTHSFFHIYGYQIFNEFSDKGKIETPFYQEMLKIFAKRLPLISKGLIRGYEGAPTEYSTRISKEVLANLFPDNVEYLKDENVLRYFYSQRESFTDISLDPYFA